ncbi:uncharacterized protein LOC121298678 isoform X2 [Polyodon spathula]|nr:uncharacterized protein LOC121298678 isoform X2 [Polyodon spathula]
MNGSTPTQALARSAVHSDKEDSDEAPNFPDSIADHQPEDPAQEGHPALDTTLTPNNDIVGALTPEFGALTPESGDVPAVSWSLDQGLVLTAGSDDKKEEKKEKNHLQKKSKAKKMKKNKPYPGIASSAHGRGITKVLEDLGPWWGIGFLVVILLCMYSADATHAPASVCSGQIAVLDLNTQGPVKGPYTIYKGILRNGKEVYSDEIVSNCPPKPYVIPADQIYLFCNSDNRTALLLVLIVTLENNSKFTVEFTTQDDNPGSKETILQVNATDCPSRMTKTHNDTNTDNSSSDNGTSIPTICGSVIGVLALLVAFALAGCCWIKRCKKDGLQENIGLDQVDERDQQAVAENGYQPVANSDAAGSGENQAPV